MLSYICLKLGLSILVRIALPKGSNEYQHSMICALYFMGVFS